MSHAASEEAASFAASSNHSHSQTRDRGVGGSPHSSPGLSHSPSMEPERLSDHQPVGHLDEDSGPLQSLHQGSRRPSSPDLPASYSQGVLEDEDWHGLNATQTSNASASQEGAFVNEFDLESLMQRFHDRMRDNRSEDLVLEERFCKLMEFYADYRSVGIVHEQERAVKRLCTRVAFIRNAEQQLKSQRVHYESVRNAFQGALNLLSSGATQDEQSSD